MLFRIESHFAPRLLLMTDNASEKVPASFEAALAELESIVSKMETGEMPLAESLAAYRRGARLVKHCQETLATAQHEIQVLEQGMLAAFEPDDAGRAAPNES